MPCRNAISKRSPPRRVSAARALSTWLTRIAINEALMRRRKKQAQAASIGNVIPLRPEDQPATEPAEDPALSPESATMRTQL